MTVVLDASAILAHILGEAGSDRVDAAFVDGAVCSAVNWAEVVQHTTRHGVSRSALSAYAQVTGLMIEPLTQADAESAGGLFVPGDGLSLGDRCCLALADRLDATALTADRQWAGRPAVEVIR
jgi:PIN domain nuclease of toxin-antitoxin system